MAISKKVCGDNTSLALIETIIIKPLIQKNRMPKSRAKRLRYKRFAEGGGSVRHENEIGFVVHGQLTGQQPFNIFTYSHSGAVYTLSISLFRLLLFPRNLLEPTDPVGDVLNLLISRQFFRQSNLIPQRHLFHFGFAASCLNTGQK